MNKNVKGSSNGYCSLKCAAQIGIELTQTIQEFHNIGYLHLDIKPDNVLIGSEENQGKLCLIDYGISEKWSDANKKHRVARKRQSIFGNINYMSKNGLQFRCQSRRDDMIGLLYMLIKFVKGQLAWETDKYLDQGDIILMKQRLTP